MGIFERLTNRLGITTPQLPPRKEYTPGDFHAESGYKLYKPDLKEAVKSDVQVFEAGKYWEFPDVPFRSIYTYYKRDPGIQSAVNAYKNEILGPGFYVTSNNDAVTEFVEEWNRNTNFEQKLTILLTDTLMLGIALAEKLKSGSDFDVVPVDMRTIVAARRDEYGHVTAYKQQTMVQQFVDLDPGDFIRFEMNPVGRQAWPIGIFHAMIMPFFEFEGEPWSLADGASLMRQDALRLIHNLSFPRVWHIYENASEEKLKAQKERDKATKAGERSYVNSKFEIMQETVDASPRFADKVDFITNAIENALQAPTAKIMTAAGISNATYASAESAREMFSKTLEGIKRQWEEQIEQQIYKPLLELNGFDFASSKLEFHWGVPDKAEIDIQQIVSLVASGIMTIDEAREAVKQMNLPINDEQTDAQKEDLELRARLRRNAIRLEQDVTTAKKINDLIESRILRERVN